MDKKYWDKLAPLHKEEIFDVLANDTGQVIRKQLEKLGSRKKTAIDLGCAVGKWLPLLSENFGKVIAVDISPKFIEIARERNKNYQNIDYLRADISHPGNKIPASDLALCVNAMMMPSIARRKAFLRATARALTRGGALVLVVPSLESALFSEMMLDEINRRKGLRTSQKKDSKAAEKYYQLRQGIVHLDSVPYKHYLKEEMIFMLEEHGFNATDPEKVEYAWSTEIDQPPRWLSHPRPWDWLFISVKK